MTEKKEPGVRELQLPAEIDVIVELALHAFQYPENETWSIQSDEKEGTLEMANNLRRLWPLIRLLQLVSPALRDILRGYVWEEDEGPVGLTNFQRRGATDTWHITTVAVLPSHRRRGIGRKLVQATLNYMRERSGKVVLLDVIAGNLPAYTLYERLGFEHFTGSVVFDYSRDEPPAELALPDGYVVSPLKFSDWRTRYELERRITPLNVQEYEPIEEARFRQPSSMQLLMKIVQKAQGVRQERMAIRTDSEGQTAAWGEYRARIRPGGLNGIRLQVDPAHAELAPYLLRRLIRTMHQVSPGRRTEFGIPPWQDALIKAAEAAGCTKRYEFHRMGLAL
jgi:ribosomal protein S18 acetylase RimI-like enzyme